MLLNSLKAIGRIGPILWQTIKRFSSTERHRDAQALTYTTLFALVPVLTVMFVILSSVPAFHQWSGGINAKTLAFMLPQGSEQFSKYLVSFIQQAKNLTWVGVLILFVTALSLLRGIEVQFNRIWNVDKPRSGVQTFFRYWAVLSLGPVLLVGALALSSLIASLPVLDKLSYVPLPVRALPWLISVVALTAMYILVPNCRVPWRNALIAAVLIAFLLEGGKYIFAKVVGMFPSYKLIYGAFAIVPLFLLWVYLAWILLLFGAEFSYALSHYAPVNRKLPLLWQRLLLVERMARLQAEGTILTESGLISLLPELTAVQVRMRLQHFQQQGLAAQTQDGQWLWLKDRQKMSISELVMDLTQTDLQAPIPVDLNISEEQRMLWIKLQEAWLKQSQAVLNRPLSSIFISPY